MIQGNPEVRKEAGRGAGEILKVWSHLPALLGGADDIVTHAMADLAVL